MATVDCGQPWASNESLTNVKIHQLFDNSTISGIVRADMSNASSPIYIAAAAPTANPTPIAGNVWFDTANAVLRIYDGTDWIVWARGWVYTNRSGSSVVAGDVVILDTANASSVKKTTTASSTDVFGVVLVGGADAAKVIVLTEGYVPVVNVADSTAIGDYLFTSTTSGSATSSATAGSGAFAKAMTSTAGAGTVSAQLGGAGMAALASGFNWTAIDQVSFSRSNTSTGTQSVSHSLGKVPKLLAAVMRLTSVTRSAPVGWASAIAGTIQSQHVAACSVAQEPIALTGYTFLGLQPNASNYLRGSITAISTTDITITWSSVGTPTADTIEGRIILMA